MTTELGEHDCATSAKFSTSYLDWADTGSASGRDKVSYLGWTFNSDYNCDAVNSTLIIDNNGTPTVAGVALRDHLIKENGR